jgi:hypothetical protein
MSKKRISDFVEMIVVSGMGRTLSIERNVHREGVRLLIQFHLRSCGYSYYLKLRLQGSSTVYDTCHYLRYSARGHESHIGYAEVTENGFQIRIDKVKRGKSPFPRGEHFAMS